MIAQDYLDYKRSDRLPVARWAKSLLRLSDQLPQIQRYGARYAPPARYGNWTENLVLLDASPSKFGKYVNKVLPVGAVLGELFLVEAWRSKLMNQEEPQFCSVRGCLDERSGCRVQQLIPEFSNRCIRHSSEQSQR
jgi:hypothetical protein